MLFKREYIVLMTEPSTKVVIGVWKGKSKEDGEKWIQSVSGKDKFKNTIPQRSSKLILNLPLDFNKTLNIVLAVMILFLLLQRFK